MNSADKYYDLASTTERMVSRTLLTRVHPVREVRGMRLAFALLPYLPSVAAAGMVWRLSQAVSQQLYEDNKQDTGDAG